MESNQLPKHLRRWVRPEVQSRLHFEPELDCAGCTRFPGKCCAFQPFIANFIASFYPPSAHFVCVPLGLLATQEYQARYYATPMKERGADLFCVNFEKGRCRVWEDRPAECASYFCESARGDVGLAEWKKLSEQWNQLEANVAQKAMFELGFTWPEISEQVDWIHDPPENIDLEKAWGRWRGREADFYRLCREWADSLKDPDSASF